ncbi:Inositol 2-dehydrogenase/D-chiro-inositol 3-dehydrogenase [subsurface metagenome]
MVIASPNASHAEQAVAAAEAGKHIYLEKPMAISLEDCRKIVKAVDNSNVKCDMGYHRRLSPLPQYAKGLIKDGKLGDLALVESDYFHYVPGDWDIWEWAGKKDIAGTPIHGGTGHNIDLLRYFCGEVTEVSCYRDIKMPRKIQVETEDIAIINLRFENGAMGRVGLFLGPILPFLFSFRLFGTRGTVVNNRVWLDTIPRFYDFGHEQDCIRLPESWVWDNVQGGVSETWKECIDTFIDDIRLDRKPFNDAVSGFNTAAVCFAALQSAADKKTVTPERL